VSIVVSDTSPIRALNHLKLLDVLGQLFDRVFIPPAVLSELTHPPARFAAVDITQHGFIEVRAPQDRAQVQRLLQLLDSGESEALALALEVHAEALLIDEATGRSVAVDQGMPVIGTLGILSRAKTRGHIVKVSPLLEKLRSDLDFYISDELRERFLRSAGE
jgi:hypothetical protein